MLTNVCCCHIRSLFWVSNHLGLYLIYFQYLLNCYRISRNWIIYHPHQYYFSRYLIFVRFVGPICWLPKFERCKFPKFLSIHQYKTSNKYFQLICYIHCQYTYGAHRLLFHHLLFWQHLLPWHHLFHCY